MVPVVRTLQKRFPKAEITWVIGQNMRTLVEGLERVEFVSVQKERPLENLLAFYREMRGRRYDVLLAAQASMRAHLLLPAIKAPVRVGFTAGKDFHHLFVNHRVQIGEGHLLDGFLALAGAVGASERVLEWRLPLAPADEEFARVQLPGDGMFWLAVNPAASKPERNWFPDRYAEIINRVVKEWNWGIVLMGGPNVRERTLANLILDQVAKRDQVVDLVGKTTPKKMAAVLGRARLLLAPDTGPVHIATAMGTPVVGMYAVAPSKLSGPYFSPHLAVDRYGDAVERFLGKAANSVKWGTRVHTQKAMELITVDSVFEKLQMVRNREQMAPG